MPSSPRDLVSELAHALAMSATATTANTIFRIDTTSLEHEKAATQMCRGLQSSGQPAERVDTIEGARELSTKRALPKTELLGHAAQQPAAERAPRDDAHAVRLARWEHLELAVAVDQVVQTLLGNETEEMACLRGLVRARDVPP